MATITEPDITINKKTVLRESFLAAGAALAGVFFGGPALLPETFGMYAALRTGVQFMIWGNTGENRKPMAPGSAIMYPALVILPVCAVFAGSYIYDRFYPDVSAKSAAIQLAADEIFGGKNSARECVPYYSFVPWHGAGEKLGDMCVDVNREKTLNPKEFIGSVSINNAAPYREDFDRRTCTEKHECD
ncbi:MAG: hypothetical protein P4M15_08860 [Alphaproteobacteria bacterium]|nr:hypothetical protein [Alphaproteobacteria bacterium]